MKTKFIPLFLAVATVCAARAQSSASAPAAENRAVNGFTSSSSQRQQDDLAKARQDVDELLKTYTEQSSKVVDAKNRVAQLEAISAYQNSFSSSGGGSVGRFGQRLQAVVRRGDSAAPGSIIVTSPMSQDKLDQLSEDLTVLNYIFTRNFERTFGEKETEYRLGVPITMSGGRMVQTSYLENFGVLIKVHVPFPVVSSGDNDKKSEPAANADSDWEKARRAVFGGGDGEGGAPATEQSSPYDEKLVGELKRQMLDALKSAANIRNLEPDQPITVAIIGGPNFVVKGFGGGRASGVNAVRPTIMTIRITKAQADGAAKNPDAYDLSKLAIVLAYFDSASATTAPHTVTSYGGYGGMGVGGGSYGGYAPVANPAGR